MKTHWTDGMVLLRPYRSEDSEALYDAVIESLAVMLLWMPWCHANYSRKESQEWVASRPEAWAQGEAYSFAVTDARDGTFLGGCGLNQLNSIHQYANLGYWVRASAWGRGVATAATQLVAQFGFQELGLQRIEILMVVENKASRRVAEKAGAQYEGRARHRLYVRDEARDAFQFSLLPADVGLAPTPDTDS